jgi:hypothetical protein
VAGRDHMLHKQVLVMLLAVGAYLAVRGITQGDPSAAHGHAERVLEFERSLRLGWENRAQDLILGSSFLVSFFNFVYVWCFWPGVVGALVFAYRRDRVRYLILRNAMFISGSVGLIVFALFPVSPPRFLTGFTDTVATLSGSGSVAHPSSFTNEYAAMPSFHVGWTVLAGVVVFGAMRHKIVRWIALLPGVVMSMTVVVTANHYVLDAVAGIVVSLGGLYLSREAHRIRERRRAATMAPLAVTSVTPVDQPARTLPVYDQTSVAA